MSKPEHKPTSNSSISWLYSFSVAPFTQYFFKVLTNILFHSQYLATFNKTVSYSPFLSHPFLAFE